MKYVFGALKNTSSIHEAQLVMLIITTALGMSACLEKNSPNATNQSTQSATETNGTLSLSTSTNATQSRYKVSGVAIKDNAFKVSGTGLKSIVGIKLKSGNQLIPLKIMSNDDQSLNAGAKEALRIVAGTVYHLILTDANASDDSVPIVVETPPGYIEPASLKGTGAEIGTVLKWNGKNWAPASDYIGVGSNSTNLMFMGYTKPYTAALGGLKGANAKCHEEFPGSHWATVDEIVKLGPNYPWTYTVWIKEIPGQAPSYHDVANDNYTAGLRSDNCYDWTRTTLPSNNAPLSENSGHRVGSALDSNGQERRYGCTNLLPLACVR